MTTIVAGSVAVGAQTSAPGADQLKNMSARFAPVDLSADVGKLPSNERQALAKLVEAAKVMDTLFLRQVWAGNETMLLNLLQDSSPLGRERLAALMGEGGIQECGYAQNCVEVCPKDIPLTKSISEVGGQVMKQALGDLWRR